ncbi:MAG: hypothetical protein ACRD7E_15690 [Bryobacteraceae bacterium]
MYENRYIFTGNAVGLGGNITEPPHKRLLVQGCSSIPATGGESRSSVSAYRIGGILSLQSAATRAAGASDQRKTSHATLVASRVKGLNVEDKLTVGLIRIALFARKRSGNDRPLRSRIDIAVDDMKIEGYPVRIRFDTGFCRRYDSREKLTQALQQPGAAQERVLPDSSEEQRRNPFPHGVVPVSLVEKIECDHPNVEIRGNLIYLPGFGRIHIGELLVGEFFRRLTAIRLKLGSPVHGDLAIAEGHSNGHDIP